MKLPSTGRISPNELKGCGCRATITKRGLDESGLSLAVIARHEGVTMSSISKGGFAIGRGVGSVQRGGTISIDTSANMSPKFRGSSAAAIARHLGVNTSCIVRSLERMEKGKERAKLEKQSSLVPLERPINNHQPERSLLPSALSAETECLPIKESDALRPPIMEDGRIVT